MKDIPITGVDNYDKSKKILGYAVCRQWKDTPGDVEVWEYADSEEEAKKIIKSNKKDYRYKWFVGVYQ